MKRAFQKDNSAVAQIYGFMVAGLVFVAVAGGIVAWSQLAGSDPAAPEQAAQDVDAGSLAALLADSPGQGWSGDPDALQRLGLSDGQGGLDGDHVALLNMASLAAADNGLVDYEEALASFGLAEPAGFNLTITPLGLEEALQDYDFSNTHALYIGDFGTLASITLPLNNATIDNANVQLNLSMAAGTVWERDTLRQIGVDFDNEVHLTLGGPSVLVQITTVPNVKIPLLTHLGGLSLWEGDVLFDDKQYLDSVVPGKLASGQYDLLVVGAGIDHSTLTSNAVKGSIDTFVRGGGTLMVFGATGNNFGWMQPLFSVQATTVSGAITASNPGHAILDTPWDLSWSQYNSQGLAWDVADPALFDRILLQGGEDVLAISKPGSFGSGMVFLSSLKASVIGGALGAAEAQHLMFNMLLYEVDLSHVDPSLGFGPPPPGGIPISSTSRIMTVQDAGLGPIPVRVDLLAWGTR